MYLSGSIKMKTETYSHLKYTFENYHRPHSNLLSSEE